MKLTEINNLSCWNGTWKKARSGGLKNRQYKLAGNVQPSRPLKRNTQEIKQNTGKRGGRGQLNRPLTSPYEFRL